jgi:hypothetical protein
MSPCAAKLTEKNRRRETLERGTVRADEVGNLILMLAHMNRASDDHRVVSI